MHQEQQHIINKYKWINQGLYIYIYIYLK
jgi:hypothetical protein